MLTHPEPQRLSPVRQTQAPSWQISPVALQSPFCLQGPVSAGQAAKNSHIQNHPHIRHRGRQNHPPIRHRGCQNHPPIRRRGCNACSPLPSRSLDDVGCDGWFDNIGCDGWFDNIGCDGWFDNIGCDGWFDGRREKSVVGGVVFMRLLRDVGRCVEIKMRRAAIESRCGVSPHTPLSRARLYGSRAWRNKPRHFKSTTLPIEIPRTRWLSAKCATPIKKSSHPRASRTRFALSSTAQALEESGQRLVQRQAHPNCQTQHKLPKKAVKSLSNVKRPPTAKHSTSPRKKFFLLCELSRIFGRFYPIEAALWAKKSRVRGDSNGTAAGLKSICVFRQHGVKGPSAPCGV